VYNECRHIMPSGARCKSPALRESAFCYYHVNLRRTITPKTTVDHMFVKLPSLEGSEGIQLALMEVLTALASTRIDAKRAGLLLYGIQIAAQVNRCATHLKKKPVRSVEIDDEGNDLAPERTRCEPPNDCPTCPRRDYCDDWEECKEELLDTECKPANEKCQSCPVRDECSDCVDSDESETKEDTDEAGSFSGLLSELTGCAANLDAQPSQPCCHPERVRAADESKSKPRSFRASRCGDESRNLHLNAASKPFAARVPHFSILRSGRANPPEWRLP